jgi:hypothetical protein
MRTLSQKELLAVWEAGLDLALPELAVDLLRAAGAEGDPARLTPGQLDAGLLDIRERLFGADMSASAQCPRCGQELEFEMRVEDVRMPSPMFVAEAELAISHGNYSVEFRLPEAGDLVGLHANDSAMELLGRCVLRAQADGRDIAPAELPVEVAAAVSRRMAEADPQGEIELSVECASCRFAWCELFDIVSFLRSEIHSWAVRTLNEIHQLAAAYGWSENEALSVSPRRRAFYLEAIAG